MMYTPSAKLGIVIDHALQEAGEYGQDLFQRAFKDNGEHGIVVMYTESGEDQSDVHDRMDELVDNIVTLVIEARSADSNIFIGTLDADIGALGGCTCNVYVLAKDEKSAVKRMKTRLEKLVQKIEKEYEDGTPGFDDSAADA